MKKLTNPNSMISLEEDTQGISILFSAVPGVECEGLRISNFKWNN